MRDINQQLIEFNFEKNFRHNDFFVSKSNKHIFNLLNSWPNWEKNFLNISGERFSGKSHLIDIFIKKFKGIKLDATILNNESLKKIKTHQNVVLENLTTKVDENLIYSLLNIIDQDNKYILITTIEPIVYLKFDLVDLNSRFKNFLLMNIEKPDDELIFALILKNLSDRQIFLEKKLINYIIKRIDRSYGKIFDLIYKIDQLSLIKKKSIDLKIIKEVLGE